MSLYKPDLERLAVWVIGLLVVAGSLGVGYLGSPYTASPADIETAKATPGAEISSFGDGYVIRPTGDPQPSGTGGTDTALVFYPGARVHPNAYLPVLAPVTAETGMTIFIPQAPLSLAVFDIDMAAPIIESHPEVEEWYVGGHSLGGAMACRYAHGNADQLTGLVLFGSYCDRSLRGTDVQVLSVQGSRDTVVDRTTYRENRANLPDNTTVEVTITGMNHTQFGSYAGQRGDSRATVPYRTAHEQLQAVLIEFVRKTAPDSTT